MIPDTVYNAGQIPLAPIRLQAILDKDAWWFACPACDEAVDFKQKHCRLCGQRIDWASTVIEENTNPNETVRPNWIMR